MNEINLAFSTLTFQKEAFHAVRKHRPMYVAFIMPILFGIGIILRRDPYYTISMSSLEKLAFAIVMSVAALMVQSLVLQFISLIFGKRLNFWNVFNIGGISYLPLALAAVFLWILNDYTTSLPEMIFGLLLKLSLILYLYSFWILIYGLVVIKDIRQLEMEENAGQAITQEQELETGEPARKANPSQETFNSAIPNKPTGEHDNEDLVKLLKGDEGGINVYYRPNLVSDFSKEHFPNKGLALKFAEAKAMEFDTIIISDLP